jgi:hypothetical protein
MNLVQIQDRLKDMPLQAVMQYANGMNPEVPPYLALGELNRRKSMQQKMQPTEMPQGTVKEQLEQEVGLAALQKQLISQLQTQGLRQQQAAANQGQQMARMPGPAPQGVPQPQVPEEVEMADGGVATLRVPDDQFAFGSGGIIAFKNGGINPEFVTDPYEDQEVEPSDRQKRRAAIDEAERLRREEIRERAERQKRAEEQAAQIEFLERAKVPADMLEAARQGRVLTTNPITPDRNFPDNRGTGQRFPPGPPSSASVTPGPVKQPVGIATVAPPAAASPVAPQGVAYPQPGPMQQALAARITGPQAPYPDYDEERRKAEERNPYLKKQPGEQLEQYLRNLEMKDREDQSRFQEMEKERTRGALWKSLMAAGEASRGQKGIGALLGGFGRTAGEEMEAGRGREEKQRALMREREMNRVKISQEIENARIAAAQGQEKERMEHLQKAAQYNQRNREIETQIGVAQANIEAAKEGRQVEINAANARSFAELQAKAVEGNLDRANRILVANIQAASANRPGEAERIFDEYQRRLKADPSGKSAAAYMAVIREAKGIDTRAEDARTRQIAAQIKPKQEELKELISTPLGAKDPRVQQLRKEIDDLIKQIPNQPGGSSQAPLGSRENPIPIR